LFAGVALVVRLVLTSVATDFTGIALAQVCHGASFMTAFYCNMQLVNREVPSELKASGLGLLALVQSGMASILSSVGGGWLSDHLSIPSVMRLDAIFVSVLVSTATLVYLFRHRIPFLSASRSCTRCVLRHTWITCAFRARVPPLSVTPCDRGRVHTVPAGYPPRCGQMPAADLEILHQPRMIDHLDIGVPIPIRFDVTDSVNELRSRVGGFHLDRKLPVVKFGDDLSQINPGYGTGTASGSYIRDAW
jgi:hypothetical protein